MRSTDKNLIINIVPQLNGYLINKDSLFVSSDGYVCYTKEQIDSHVSVIIEDWLNSKEINKGE